MEKVEYSDQQSLSGNENEGTQNQKQEIGGLIGNYKINNTTLTIKPNVGKIDVKLFVGQIPKNINEEYITNFFSKFGEILEVQIIRDPKTQQHKGCAFVKFQSLTQADETIKRCVCFNFQNNLPYFFSQSEIMLPGSNAYLQLRWAEGEADRLGLSGIDEKHQTKLFVGSIPKNATEDNLKDIFNVYGQIEELHLMKDSDGTSKCCAFIKFINKESALLAIRALNAQAYILDSNKPIEVRFAEKKKNQVYPPMEYMQKPLNFLIQPQFMKIPQIQQPPFRQQQQIIFYEYWTQEGKQAYFNPQTGQTQYEKPSGVTILPYAMYQQTPNFYGQQPVYNQMQQQFLQPTNTVLNINDISGTADANTKKQGPNGSNLFIFHLPNDWKESDLYSLFMPFGDIISTRIMTDKQTGKSKGYGFISYNNPEAAKKAISQMNGFNINGKRLKVEIKKGNNEDDIDNQQGVPTLTNARYSPFS